MNRNPMSGTVEEKLRRSFAAQGLMRTLGAEMTAVSEGKVTIEASLGPAVSQQQGFAHAGLTFAIGDSAAGYAALSMMPLDRDVVTAEIKINLLAPATGDRLEAVGRVLRAGRKLTTVQSDVYAISGHDRVHVAVLLGTMVAVRSDA